jgi:Heterokaryon incompatibility protein (HET)
MGIRMYIKHVSEWQPPKSLAFFGQLTSMPKLPDLGNVNSSSNGDRPLLSYLPNQYPGSPEAFHQARQWLVECQNRHPECIRPPSILPKRVLDLGRPGEELKVALYITRGEVNPYVALSYTWGEADWLVTCRNSNDNPLPAEGSQFPTTYVVKRLTSERQSGQAKPCFLCVSFWSPDDIPLNAFPETLRDALQITKALGFRYIWIDSLCISATSTRSSNQSILSELQNDRIGIGTLWNCDASKKPVEIFVGDTMKTLDLEEEFISTRGWVFQERLVSTATLHYTEE